MDKRDEKFLKKWEAEREHGVQMYAIILGVQVIFVAHVCIMLYNAANKQDLLRFLHWSMPYLGGIVALGLFGFGIGKVFWILNEKKYHKLKDKHVESGN